MIQAFKTPSNSNDLSLVLTGQQGDVMQESMRCSKTIVWNLLPNNIKKELKEHWKEYGVMVFIFIVLKSICLKMQVSAGGVITIAILSQLCGLKIDNKWQMTGEIDLNGSILPVGGIDIKLDGAISAGVERVFMPEKNRQDYEIAKQKRDINIEVNFVSHISQG